MGWRSCWEAVGGAPYLFFSGFKGADQKVFFEIDGEHGVILMRAGLHDFFVARWKGECNADE